MLIVLLSKIIVHYFTFQTSNLYRLFIWNTFKGTIIGSKYVGSNTKWQYYILNLYCHYRRVKYNTQWSIKYRYSWDIDSRKMIYNVLCVEIRVCVPDIYHVSTAEIYIILYCVCTKENIGLAHELLQLSCRQTRATRGLRNWRYFYHFLDYDYNNTQTFLIYFMYTSDLDGY